MAGVWNPTIYQGSTFNPTLDYSSPDLTLKTVTAVTKSARAKVTANGHGLTGKWKVFLSGVGGMKQINSRDLTRIDQAYTATVINSNDLSLDVDSSQFAPYTSGGELSFHTPINLTGYTARMQIREDITSGTVLISLTTENGGITLGGVFGTITLLIMASVTAAIAWTTAVYDLEIISPSGIVTRLVEGRITVSPEVTR